MPKAGSIYEQGDHVMFVEEVNIIEEGGKNYWEIKISEENNYHADGHFAGAEEVEVEGAPDVYRWERTIKLEVDPHDPAKAVTDGEFIHFNY